MKKKFWQKKDYFPLYKSPARAKIRKAGRFIIAAIFCAFFAAPLFAETYYWAGGGADNNWRTKENWRTVSEAGPVATAYPGATTGDIAYIAGTYTVTIDTDIEVAALNIKKSGNTFWLDYDWTTTLTGSGKLTFGAMDFNRASGTDNKIGTLEIDCDATCSGELQTHSGTALIINSGSGKKLATNKLIHSAGDKKPKSQITVKGILAVTEDIKLQANGNNGCNSLYVDGGTVTAKNLTWDTNKTYENEGLDAINNSGTITLSGDLTATGPVTNSRTIKSTGGTMAFAAATTNSGTLQTNAGAITFSDKVIGASGTITSTSGNITTSATDASALGTVSTSGVLKNSGTGAVTVKEFSMGADTSVTNSTGGAVTITKLTGAHTATLTGGTNAITVSSYANSPTIIVDAGSSILGTQTETGTLTALTVKTDATATITGNITTTSGITNNGTLATNAELDIGGPVTNNGAVNAGANLTFNDAVTNNKTISADAYNITFNDTVTSGATSSITATTGTITTNNGATFESVHINGGSLINAGSGVVTATTFTIGANNATIQNSASGEITVTTLTGAYTATLKSVSADNGITVSGYGATTKIVVDENSKNILLAGGTGVTLDTLTIGTDAKATITGDITTTSGITNNGTLATNAELAIGGTVTNNGSVNAGANLTFSGDVNNNKTITVSAYDITFNGKVTSGAAAKITTTTGDITTSAAAPSASSLGTIETTGGSLTNAGSGEVTATKFTMNDDTAITANDGAGKITITTLSGAQTATLTNGAAASGITITGYDNNPTIAVAADSASVELGEGTITALTTESGSTTSISGELTTTGALSNTGTMTANYVVTVGTNLTNSGTLTASSTLTVSGTSSNTGAMTTTGLYTATGNVSTSGTLSTGNLTFAGNFTNTGTVGSFTSTGTVTATGASPTFTGNTGTSATSATIPTFVYAPTDISGTGLTISDANTFTNLTCTTNNAKVTLSANNTITDTLSVTGASSSLTLSGSNTIGTLSATGASSTITLGAANTIGTLTVQSGGGTLAVNGTQTVTTLSLKGASETSHLTVNGSGSIALSSTQSSGQYLTVTKNAVSITSSTSDTYYYSAANSTYDTAPLYGEDNNWILLNGAMEFIWTGTTSTDWATASNWNYKLVPGLASATGGVSTVGYPVKIPDSPSGGNFPVAAASYSVGALNIRASASSSANLELSSTANVSVVAVSGITGSTGTLTNYGTIKYSSSGRVTNGTGFINDASNQGTVDFASTSGASDLSTPTAGYYNLTVSGSGAFNATAALTVGNDFTISGSGANFTASGSTTVGHDLTQSGSGTFTANGALTVTNALTVSAGNAYFNNGTGNTATSAASTSFTTTGTLSLGNTAGDTFTVTGDLELPSTLGSLSLAGTITSNGTNGITISKDATLNANTTFASATSLGAAINLSGSALYTVTTRGSLTTSATNTLTLTNASLINTGAVTGGNIIFEETSLKPHQVFTPNTSSTYKSVTINKTSSGEMTVNQALTATDFIVTINGTLTTSAAVTATNFTITENNIYVAHQPINATNLTITQNGTLTANENATITAANLTITKNTNATFNALVTVNTAYTDATTAGNLAFNAGCAFTPATTFNATGSVTLNGSTTACAFTGGLTHTVGPTIIQGNLNTSNTAINLEATTIQAASAIATAGGAAVFGTTSVNAETTITTSGGSQTFGNTTLSADLTINSGAGTATFSGTLDGANDLVSSGTGLLTFTGTVGSTSQPTSISAAGSATFNAATSVAGPITIAGDGQFNGVTNVAGNIAITGNASINGATTTTSSGAITVGGNAAINAATTSATTITVEGTTNVAGPSITSGGLQLYKDSLTFNTACTVTGKVQAAANVATSGAYAITFSDDLWLYTSAAATLGENSGSLSISGDLYFVGSSKSSTVASSVTAKNILLLHGSLSVNAALKSNQDMIWLCGNYDTNTKDPASQVERLFAYKHASRKCAASYTNDFPSACPDGTSISDSWSGSVYVTSGSITAGKNFYANGLTISSSGSWNLNLPDNGLQTAAFAEIYNSSISNCVANYPVAAAENNSVTSCSNVQTKRPLIKEAYTVYDDAIYVSFKDSDANNVYIENSCNEISAAAQHISNSAGAFVSTWTNADCTTSTDGAGDLLGFYIKANADHKWNTDANTISVGADQSSNRAGSHCSVIPYLNLPKALSSVYETLRDSSKNRIAHYYSATPDTSAVNNAPGKTFTAVADKCAPVLIKVLTGQELHNSTIASQTKYDAHNFVEFVYSEPVTTSGGTTSVLASDTNIRAANDLGATTNNASGITFAGLATCAAGSIDAAVKTGSGSPHSLYRNFSTSAGGTAADQAARIRLSIAGYVDGTVSSEHGSCNNWIGYISSATSPSGSITRIANSNIKDLSSATNSLDANSTQGHPLPTLTVQNSESELYGTWDVTPPSFAPIRINGTTKWEQPAFDGSQEFEFVGASYATGTLSAIEVHWFDNQPTYNESLQWFTKVGWAQASSETEYSTITSYAADVRGGSKQDSSEANATKGGIRFCSLYNANNAFKYALDGTSEFFGFTQNIKAGAESSLFNYAGDDSGAAIHTTGAEDGLYCKLLLDQSSYTLQTTFLIIFDSSQCYVTDLAGNRIQCGQIKMKSIDRTPPAFTMSAVPLGTKDMLLVFSKALNTEQLTVYNSATDYTKVSALEYIPKSLELTDASGTNIQIDQNAHAKLLFKTKNSTGLLITLNQNAVLNDITKGVFVTAKSVAYNYDPLAGISAPTTYIQDAIGNYVVGESKHAFSDFAVNAIQPQYAYDNSLTDEGAATGYGLYQEGSWAVRDWNAEQANYGTISANKEIILQASLYDGTSDNSGGFDKSQIPTAFFAPNPDADSVSTEINKNTDKSWRIWLPNFTQDIFGSLAPANNKSCVSIDGSANDSGAMFDIPKETASSNFKSGDQVSFIFKYGNYTVDHFANGTNYPLYAVRLKDLNDITSLDLWSFKVKETTLQRGGVTILNNVIDVNNGENTVVQVDMKESGNLNVIVMTLDGNVIKYLRHGYTDAGTHYYNWNGTNNGGSKVARGLYFVRVIGPGIDETRKVMCVK